MGAELGSTTLDDEKKHPGLAQDIDRQITYALHVLGESGVEETAKWENRLRRRGTREETIKAVRAHFSGQLETWQFSYREEGPVPFFERMRERCYDLYDKTNAWDTITALAQVVSAAIGPQVRGEAGPGDAIILDAISRFLALLDVDMAIYKAVNRGHTRSVIDNCSAAQPKAQELEDLLDSGGSSDRSVDPGRGKEQLRKELRAEAHALARCTAELDKPPRPWPRTKTRSGSITTITVGRKRRRGGRRSGRAPVLAGPPVDQRPVRRRRQVKIIIRRLEEEQRISTEELGADSLQRAKDIASRLDPWASLLRSVAQAYDDSKPMRLPNVQIRYCFPFAVKVPEERIGELSSALRKRVPGAAATVPGAGEPVTMLPCRDLPVSSRPSCRVCTGTRPW